jgi:murein DD-endopeptidase MepM/ murein hydrolase activator NlpD
VFENIPSGRRLISHLICSIAILLVAISLPACSEPTESPTFTPVASPQTADFPAPSLVPGSTAQNTATPTVLTPSPTPGLEICSPLKGVSLGDISGRIVNPFHPPRLGSDDPHQGVDLADLDPIGGYARQGLEVHSILAGYVAAVINNRFPYGNAVIVETPLSDIPAQWLSQNGFPTPGDAILYNSSLTCPPINADPAWNKKEPSLYVLYAHLKGPVNVHLNDRLSCGQALGVIGETGNALNPHLHIEVRVGPGAVRFASMAHYDTSATQEEMGNYCTWRVSALFPLVDPMRLLLAISAGN